MRKLRGRSPAELLDRSRQAWGILAERVGLAPIPQAPPGLGLAPSLLFPRPARQELTALYDQRPADRATILDHANAALESRFQLLGFRSLDFGRPPDWHLDPTRQRRAPGGHWSQVPYLDELVVGDHKIIWELNRHQWLVTLAQAWRITEDPRYLNRIAEALDSWLTANPPRRGINWASSLELAYRAIAWTWVLHLTGDVLPDVGSLHQRLLDALVQHGVQVERHLSTWFSPNTHLTGEALGLLYLGTGWPGLPQAERWRRSGWQILMDQLPIQVRSDGSYFEQATWYQAYTADIYLHALLLARASGLAVPPGVADRVEKAVAVVAELARPDGTLPLIGDDDGGRLLPLGPVRTDFRDTIGLGALVLNRPGTCSLSEVPAAPAWLVGCQDWQEAANRSHPAPAVQSLAFAEGGWFLLRGAEGSLVLDAGPHGALAGGHSHADALAVDLTVGGRPVIVDPGTGAYVGRWRDALRATRAHSTLCLADGTGSATPTGQFRWGRWPRITIRHWSHGEGWAALEAEHDGFGEQVPGLVHRRTAIFRNGWGWLILDRVLGPEALTQVRFQLDLGLNAALEQGVVTARTDIGDSVLRIVPDGPAEVTLGTGVVSRAYGVATESPVVVRTLTAAEGRRGVVTLLCTGPHGQVTREAGRSAWRWHGTHPDGRLAIGESGDTSFASDDLSLILN